MNLQLYIEGARVELFKDENISMTSSVQNIKDISKTFTDFTQSFTVPASEANNKIFKHWDKAEITGGFDARTRKAAKMELNFQPFKTGKIQLNKAQKKDGVLVNYQLTFFGDIIQITDLMGEDLLTDLDLSSNAHDFTSANVELGITGAGLDSGEVIYPLISSEKIWEWGTETDTDTVSDIKWKSGESYGLKWNELKPAIKLQNIMNAIRVKYGLIFSDHFFNSSDFRLLYMWASKEKGNMKAYGSNDILVFIDDLATLPDFSIYTTQAVHETITITITPDTGYEEVPYELTRVLTVNSSPSTTTTVTTPRTGTTQDKVDKVAAEDSKTMKWYLAGSEDFQYSVAININRYLAPPHFNGDTGIKSVTGVVNFTDIEADGITQLGQLPKMKVVDFFKALVKMFNLVVVSNNGEFIVQTLDDWYSSGSTKDFSKYIDLSSEEVNRTNLYKVIDFKYSEPETILQDEFEDTNDRFYGDLEYESDVDGGTFEIQLPFENLMQSLLSDENFDLTNIHVGYALNKDLEPIKLKPLLFYISDTTTPFDSIGFLDDAGALNPVANYNNVGQENGVDDASITHSLNWGSEVSTFTLSEITNSLFNDYWTTYITDIFDENRRMFKFSGIIPSGELSNLKLNDKIIVNRRRYLINQFTSNLLTGEVQFELLNDMLELEAIEYDNDGLQYDLQTGVTG